MPEAFTIPAHVDPNPENWSSSELATVVEGYLKTQRATKIDATLDELTNRDVSGRYFLRLESVDFKEWGVIDGHVWHLVGLVHQLKMEAKCLDLVPRPDTINALVQRVEAFGLVLVQGARSTGKTCLARLLHLHYKRTRTPSVFIDSWQRGFVEKAGGYLHYLANVYGAHANDQDLADERTYLIFDEGQDTFWDEALWQGALYNHNRQFRGAIVFLRCCWDVSERVSHWAQVVSLECREIDNYGEAGLALSREEFMNYVQRKHGPHAFSLQFLEMLLEQSGGHAGAIDSCIGICKNTPEYWEMQLSGANDFSPAHYQIYLREQSDMTAKYRASWGPMWRGIPQLDAFESTGGLREVFEALLDGGCVLPSFEALDENEPDQKWMAHAVKKGWVQADECKMDGIGPMGSGHSWYRIPSPVHEQFVTVLLRSVRRDQGHMAGAGPEVGGTASESGETSAPASEDEDQDEGTSPSSSGSGGSITETYLTDGNADETASVAESSAASLSSRASSTEYTYDHSFADSHHVQPGQPSQAAPTPPTHPHTGTRGRGAASTSSGTVRGTPSISQSATTRTGRSSESVASASPTIRRGGVGRGSTGTGSNRGVRGRGATHAVRGSPRGRGNPA